MKLAKKLIRKFETNNPFEICDYLDYITLTVPLIGVRGFFQYYKKVSIIYISDCLDSHLKKFVCAHELGHAIMHRDSNAIFMDTRTFLKTSLYERQANQFAVNLLLPNDNFFEDYKHLSIYQIARCFGIESSLIQYRIDQIKEK